jgi:hypothetical protein
MMHPLEHLRLTRRGTWLVLLAVVVLAALPATAAAQRRGSDHSQQRERWMQMSEEERAVLRKRYEELKRMSPEVIEELTERARGLKHFENGLRKAPPPDLERRLRGRPRADCDREVRRYMRDRSSDFGRHMREKLPPELRERFEKASHEERIRILHELRHDPSHRDRFRRALQELGRELELTAEEQEEILALPWEARKERMMHLHRLFIVQEIEANGLPEGITAEEWASWKELSPREFLHRTRAFAEPPPSLRSMFGGRRGRGWDGRGRGSGRGDDRRGPDGRRGGDGERGDRGDRGDGPPWRRKDGPPRDGGGPLSDDGSSPRGKGDRPPSREKDGGSRRWMRR